MGLPVVAEQKLRDGRGGDRREKEPRRGGGGRSSKGRERETKRREMREGEKLRRGGGRRCFINLKLYDGGEGGRRSSGSGWGTMELRSALEWGLV